MRIMEWQQSIKQQVKKYIEGPVSIAVNGSDWGMACNSIHYIDLISWLIESDIDKVSCTEHCSWHQNKRPVFTMYTDQQLSDIRILPRLFLIVKMKRIVNMLN